MISYCKPAGLPASFWVGDTSKVERQMPSCCLSASSIIGRQSPLSTNLSQHVEAISRHDSEAGGKPEWDGCSRVLCGWTSHFGRQPLLMRNAHVHMQQFSKLPCDRGPDYESSSISSCRRRKTGLQDRKILKAWGDKEGGNTSKLFGGCCKISVRVHGRGKKMGHVHAMEGGAMASAASIVGPVSAEGGKDTLPERGGVLYKTTAEIDRAVILNTLTCSAAAISDPIMSLVDTVFVGRMGTVALASLGPNAAIFNAIFFMMSLTGAIVVTETIGLAHARGDLEGVQRSLIVSVVLCMVIGVTVTIAVLIWGRELLISMGTNAEMMGPALVYLKWRVIAVPASLLLIVAQAAYRAVLDLKTPCMVVLAAGLCNAILDPILMFKANLGVAGASIATSFSQWAGVAFFAYMMTRNRDFMGPMFDLKSLSSARSRANFPWPAMSDYAQFLKDCSPLTFRALLIIATYTLSGIVATKMGTNVAAGHQLLNQIQLFQLTVLWAFLEVGQSMVVNAMGRSGRRVARAIGDRIVWWGFLASVVLTWGTWAVRTSLPRIFIQDEAVLELVKTAMVPCCGMILIGWNNALEGVLMGAGDMRFVVNVFIPSSAFSISMLMYAMYSKATLPFGGALPFIWWSLTLYYALLTLLYCFRYWVPSSRGPFCE